MIARQRSKGSMVGPAMPGRAPSSTTPTPVRSGPVFEARKPATLPRSTSFASNSSPGEKKGNARTAEDFATAYQNSPRQPPPAHDPVWLAQPSMALGVSLSVIGWATLLIGGAALNVGWFHLDYLCVGTSPSFGEFSFPISVRLGWSGFNILYETPAASGTATINSLASDDLSFWGDFTAGVCFSAAFLGLLCTVAFTLGGGGRRKPVRRLMLLAAVAGLVGAAAVAAIPSAMFYLAVEEEVEKEAGDNAGGGLAARVAGDIDPLLGGLFGWACEGQAFDPAPVWYSTAVGGAGLLLAGVVGLWEARRLRAPGREDEGGDKDLESDSEDGF